MTILYHATLGPPPNGKDVDINITSIEQLTNEGWVDHPSKLNPEHAYGKGVADGSIPAISEVATPVVLGNDNAQIRSLEKTIISRNQTIAGNETTIREKQAIINSLEAMLRDNGIDPVTGAVTAPAAQPTENNPPAAQGGDNPPAAKKQRGRPKKADQNPDTPAAGANGETTPDNGQGEQPSAGDGKPDDNGQGEQPKASEL